MGADQAIFYEVQDLVLRFWASVDEAVETSGERLFTPEGELAIESFLARGEAELTRYFSARRAKSAAESRTTRHVVSNLRLIEASTDLATLVGTATVFSGYGPRPAALGAPSSLADFSYRCRRGAEGWLLERVEGRLIFTGADSPNWSKTAEEAKS